MDVPKKVKATYQLKYVEIHSKIDVPKKSKHFCYVSRLDIYFV